MISRLISFLLRYSNLRNSIISMIKLYLDHIDNGTIKSIRICRKLCNKLLHNEYAFYAHKLTNIDYSTQSFLEQEIYEKQLITAITLDSRIKERDNKLLFDIISKYHNTWK